MEAELKTEVSWMGKTYPSGTQGRLSIYKYQLRLNFEDDSYIPVTKNQIRKL